MPMWASHQTPDLSIAAGGLNKEKKCTKQYVQASKQAHKQMKKMTKRKSNITTSQHAYEKVYAQLTRKQT